jgi:hypothetical protein
VSMLRIAIATSLGVILAVVVLYGSCAYLETREMRRALFVPPSASFQERMLQQGYRRAHLTHRWFSVWVVTVTHGCAVVGPPLDTTFKCSKPLNQAEGFPDQK